LTPLRFLGAAVLLLALPTPGCARDAGTEPAGGAETPAPTEAAEATAQLRSLPYGRWVPLAEGDERQGVVVHEPDRAAPGLNLFNPRHLARAFLLDMDGRVVRRWSLPGETRDGFHHIEPTPDGGLVALIKNHRILRLDGASEVVWSRPLPVHHDVALRADGGLWVPTRHRRWIERGGERLPILDDRLTRLDAQGRVRREISIWNLFGDRVGEERWQKIRDWIAAMEDPSPEAVIARAGADSPADVFHTNSLEILPRDVPGLGSRGDLLISIRELDLVAVVDPRSREIAWAWGPGELDRQHQPTLTGSGTVLIFDNGRHRRRSRAVEVDPQSGEIVWKWPAEPREDFYSFSRGGVQRLPNGNTLITESDAGHVVEVTPEGEVVWELLAPRQPAVGDRPPRRAAIYRLRRMPEGWPGSEPAAG
jgi:hypothetical protein